MKKDPMIIGIIFLTLLIVGGIVWAASTIKPQQTSSTYSLQDAEKPQVEVSKTSFDMGKMKLSETKSEEITLKNTGSKPLKLWGISTSCDCTYAELIYQDKVSPRFSMHGESAWSKEIPANESAILKIYYEPSIMPVQGEVSRAVHLQTNDPAMPDIAINFKAFVE